MESFNIQLTTQIAEDGILRVEMPSHVKNTVLEVLVICQPLKTEIQNQPDTQGWQIVFFEEVIGGWQGEPLVREE